MRYYILDLPIWTGAGRGLMFIAVLETFNPPERITKEFSRMYDAGEWLISRMREKFNYGAEDKYHLLLHIVIYGEYQDDNCIMRIIEV